MNTPRRTAGFTLVELMITIAILAIVSAFAVPSFSDMIQRNRRVSCANELIGALQLARSEAVRLGQLVTVDEVDDNIANGITVSNIAGTELQSTAACRGNAVSLETGDLPFAYRGNGQTNLPAAGLDIQVCSDDSGDGRRITLLSTGVLRAGTAENCNS